MMIGKIYIPDPIYNHYSQRYKTQQGSDSNDSGSTPEDLGPSDPNYQKDLQKEMAIDDKVSQQQRDASLLAKQATYEDPLSIIRELINKHGVENFIKILPALLQQSPYQKFQKGFQRHGVVPDKYNPPDPNMP